VILPLQYGNHQNYEGDTIFESGYSYTEVYIYVGIATAIIGLFSFLFSDSRLTTYAGVLFLIFLFFVCIRYVPYAEYFPIITWFRHWNRAIVLGLMGLAILIADLFRNENIKLNVKRFIALMVVSLPLALQHFYYLNKKN